MPRTRASPPLSEAAIALGLNRILTGGLMRLLSNRIRARQDALKAVVSSEAWQAYLLVEEESNQRLDAAMQRAARWGYQRGLEAGRRPRRPWPDEAR